jgi:Tol biopolymer transport system component
MGGGSMMTFATLRRPALAGLALAAVLALSAGTATAKAGNGRIVFQGCDSSTCQIYTVNPDGTALHQVTHGPAFKFSPDWSPDGRRIVYARDAGSGSAIWIAGADGTRARQLTHPRPGFFDQYPHFTPDGRRVLFTNFTADTDGGISSIRTDGTGLRVITPNRGTSYNDAVLSPNGRRLAFMRWHIGNATMRIYTRAFAGGRERPVTPVALTGWLPDWAPSGRTILFSSNLFGNRPNGAIYTVGAWGGWVRKLTRPRFPTEDWAASYAPDGRRIVFTSDRGRADRFFSGTDLYTMRSNGSHIHRIPLPGSIPYPDSPQWGTAPLQATGMTSASSVQRQTAARRPAFCAFEGARLAAPACRSSAAGNPSTPRAGRPRGSLRTS